jgi:hypothetical protein
MDSDRQPFAEMSENAAVKEHLRPLATRDACNAWIDFQINHQSSHGFCLWALESRASGIFIGAAGLLHVGFDAHLTPAVEAGWRLARPFWGQGFAVEAAGAALQFCFEEIRVTKSGKVASFDMPLARLGAIGATSPSLHIRRDANPPGSQVSSPYAPNLPLIDPCILFGGGGEPDVCKDIDHRLAVSRCRLAIARQRNAMAIVGLNDHVQVKVDATISAHSQIVDAVLAPRKAALTGSIDMKVEAGSLQWDRFLACKDIIHAYAVIRYACESEIAFVYLLASHSRILSHCISPSCSAGLPTSSRTGDRQDDMFRTNYFRRASPCQRSRRSHVDSGSFASFWRGINHFRSTPISRRFLIPSACLKRAKRGHSAKRFPTFQH